MSLFLIGGGPGSSPRVRGKQVQDGGQCAARGLIPARAGKTARAACGRAASRAHPRACGENGVVVMTGRTVRGSSPRVRGKRHRGGEAARRRGLIPARAGKTLDHRPSRLTVPAHPRACGENALLHPRCAGLRGSSPRVRGKPYGPPISSSRGRLIPARAGKTSGLVAFMVQERAHPRACGENASGCRAAPSSLGSSPRVRGQHFLTLDFTARVGRILETLEPSSFSGSYSFPGALANGGQRRAHRRGLCTGPALGRPLGAS